MFENLFPETAHFLSDSAELPPQTEKWRLLFDLISLQIVALKRMICILSSPAKTRH
jgi:hypothetical protein